MVRPVANNDDFSFDLEFRTEFSDNVITNAVPDGQDVDPDERNGAGNPVPVRGLEVFSVNGVRTNVAQEITLDSGALLTVNADGSFDYDENGAFIGLADDEVGTDTFEYRLIDNQSETSRPATVTFSITGINDAPELVADEFETLENEAFGENVLTNDMDPEGDELEVRRFTVIDDGDGGSSTLEGASNVAGDSADGTRGLSLTVNEDGTFDFDPGNFYNGLELGETAEFKFRYNVADGEGGFASEVATITITGQAEVPNVGDPGDLDKATLFVDENTGLISGTSADAGQPYSGNLFSNTNLTSQDPTDFIEGTDGDDNIWGGPRGNDKIDGNDGDDTIGFGNSGALSEVNAGDGDDFVYTVATAGGQPVEQLPTGEVDIDLGDGNDLAWISTATSTVVGGDGNDDMGVLSGDHTFDGGAGVDEFYGQKGAAISGNLDVTLGDGDDLFFIVGASTASSDVDAGDGNDFLNGGVGDDIFDGGAGNDFVLAGAGNNTVTGGAGDDIFGLTKGNGVTIITDFTLANPFTTERDLFGLTGDLTFEDLRFENAAFGTRISTGDDELAQIFFTSVGDLVNAGIEDQFRTVTSANV
ncbi:MAG: Ig-like domain-containing protein [Cyanobacteria bacterium J06623_4]